MLDSSQTPIAPNEAGNQQTALGPSRGRALGETKSLRQAAENSQFYQHQNVLPPRGPFTGS